MLYNPSQTVLEKGAANPLTISEIIEYSSPDEIAVCNLASIAVNMFVRNDKTYDFEKLKEISKVTFSFLITLSFDHDFI